MPAIHYYIWLTQLFISIPLVRNLLTTSFLVVPSFARQFIWADQLLPSQWHLPTKKERTTFKTICVACNMSLISLISSLSIKRLLLFNRIGAVYILFALCAHMTAHWWQAAQNVFVCLSVQYSLIFQISTSSMNVLITSFPLHMLACHFKGEVAESIQWDYSFACLLWG